MYGNREQNSLVNLTYRHLFFYPGYNEILTGFSDDPHIDSNNKLPNPNRIVLEQLNEQPQFRGKVAAFGSWDVFPYIVNEERSGYRSMPATKPLGYPAERHGKSHQYPTG